MILKTLAFPLLVAFFAVGAYFVVSLRGEDGDLARVCPHVVRCLDLEPGYGNSVVFMTCLRRVAAPLLWNPAGPWDRCAAAAALSMVRKQFWAVKIANTKVM
jgi:hypothetical protein